MIRPLDIVRTPKGMIAVVTETDGEQSSIRFFPNQEDSGEKNAWWDSADLHCLGSIVQVIANSLAHPFGSNREQGDTFFGEKQ